MTSTDQINYLTHLQNKSEVAYPVLRANVVDRNRQGSQIAVLPPAHVSHSVRCNYGVDAGKAGDGRAGDGRAGDDGR